MGKKPDLNFMYDEENDILYAFYDRFSPSIYEMVLNGVYLRVDPSQKGYTGFMIHDLMDILLPNNKVKVPHFNEVKIPPLKQIAL